MSFFEIGPNDSLYYEYDPPSGNQPLTFVFINAITGDTVMWQAMDAGNYVRIGELSPSSSKEELTQDYTWRSTTTGWRAAMNQPERKYPPEKLWQSNDPLEQTPVDERHKVLQETTLINRR